MIATFRFFDSLSTLWLLHAMRNLLLIVRTSKVLYPRKPYSILIEAESAKKHCCSQLCPSGDDSGSPDFDLGF